MMTTHYRRSAGLARDQETNMANRSLNILLVALLVVLGVMAAQPYIEHHLYAATAARPIETRGTLADYEQGSIAVFERVAPSVVQVVGRGSEEQVSASGEEET